ncbi:MAG: stage III sporulation protein AB [Christensenellales bacterium]|jgi:stage III sporulation protein AB
MLTLIGGALLFTAMAYIGITVKNLYKQRLELLKYIDDFAVFAEREITLYKTPVNIIIAKFKILKGEDREQLLNRYIALTDKSYLSIYGLTNTLYLRKADRQLISDFLLNLGKGNYAEEIKYIESFIKDIGNLREEAANLLRVEGRLYSRLLMLVGIALMIIVV